MIISSNDILHHILADIEINKDNPDHYPIYLQKAIAKLVLDNKNIFVKENPSFEEQAVIIVCKEHLKYENILKDGRDILQYNIIPFYPEEEWKEFLDLVVSEENLENFSKNITRYVKYINGKMGLNKILEYIAQHNMIDGYEKIIHLDKVYGNIGNLFLSYKDNISIYNKNNDVHELCFRDESFIKGIESLLDKQNKTKIISSGYKSLDDTLNGGFESGRVYLFCGKPGQGKSAFLLNLTVNSANTIDNESEVVIYITLENDLNETITRLVKIKNWENGNAKTSTNTDKMKLIKYFNNYPFILKYFNPGTSISNIYAWISNLIIKYKIRLIAIDYLGLMLSTKGYNERRFELGQLVLDLKGMSIELNVPIVTAAQINTSGYDIVPTIRNIDESRQVAQHADVVGLLYTPKYDEIETENLSNFNANSSILGLNIDKNRVGKTGRQYYILLYDFMKILCKNKYGSDIVYVDKPLESQENIEEEFNIDEFFT